MIAPKELTEFDRRRMNEAARDHAWSYYNKGVMLAVTALREGIDDVRRSREGEER